MDNFSRHILSWRLSHEYSSHVGLENLKDACAKHGIDKSPGTILVTDGGIENLGEVSRFLDQPEVYIERKIAHRDIDCSNSLIEALNKQLKYYSLFHEQADSFCQLELQIQKAVADYSSRPLAAIGGYASSEVLGGALPLPNRFAKNIAQASRNRIEAHRVLECSEC